jgi:hypothetical protein
VAGAYSLISIENRLPTDPKGQKRPAVPEKWRRWDAIERGDEPWSEDGNPSSMFVSVRRSRPDGFVISVDFTPQNLAEMSI